MFVLRLATQGGTSESLLRKVERFIDSVHAEQKSRGNLQNKMDYIPRFDLLPREIKEALKNGTAEAIPCKGSADNIYLQIRTTVEGLILNGKEYGKNRKIKDIQRKGCSNPVLEGKYCEYCKHKRKETGN